MRFTLSIFGHEFLTFENDAPTTAIEQPEQQGLEPAPSEMGGGSGHNFDRRESFDYEPYQFGFSVGGTA